MKRKIEIHNKRNDLPITLDDVLSSIESITQYNWKILWLRATGKSTEFSVLSLEEEINHSNDGYPILVNDLLKFNEPFSQIIELLIIGDKDISKLKRYENDNEMQNNCTFCIELVDSSYWEVTSSDNKTIENMILKFNHIKELPVIK